MLKAGMFIQNRYEIISRIGSGGMADVYKAKDHKLNRFVAVKVLKQEFRDDKVFISKFRAEAQSAAGLAHANIVNVYDVGEEAGTYYIVMELVDGITLKEYIKNKGRLPVREATSIALQISAGLEAAHNNGIIHRDVKPQNIIISTDGKVEVADFGIARAATTNTVNSGVMGSVHYSSPEQSRGGYSDEKSDIYSLGITMYEMLTGEVPFDGDTAVAVALRHLQEEIREPRSLVPEIPYSTNQIVLRCTQKSPDRRYPNMTELIRDLRESLVNPDGDFVARSTVDSLSKTRVISKEEVSQINAEQRTMPAYDENLDVGAAAGLHGGEEPRPNRAYQPGSYYQKSGYQEVSPGSKETIDLDRWDENLGVDAGGDTREYDPYFDAYDNPDDYAIHEGKYGEDEDFSSRTDRREKDSDLGLNPRLEKIVTVGGITVAVILGCLFLVFLANAFGVFQFGKNRRAAQTESESESETAEVQSVSVPTLLGRTEAEAQELLESYALTGRKSGEKESDEYEAGEICTQSPEPGEMVERGAEITYEVVPEVEEFELSDLSNAEQSQAQAFLLTRGLKCVIDTTRQSDTVEPGYVITTEPAPGALLKPGDTVTLFVNQEEETEPEYVTMRDLLNYTKEVATEALELQGLIPKYEYESNHAGVPENFVVRQSVEPGEQVAKGTEVTLVIHSSSAPDTAQNEGGGEWACDATLEQPAGYTGQEVRITIVQDGMEEKTVFEGIAAFPYRLQTTGAAGIANATAYIYLLDPGTGEATSTIEYPGITFSQVN